MTTYDFISSNKRKSALLMAAFFGFVLLIGYLIDRHFETGGIALALAVAYSSVSALVGYYSGDRVALRMSGAQEIKAPDSPTLYRTVENLCIATGTPMPKVHVIRDPAINAFATGRDPEHASIAVTTGALEKLDQAELEGVLAHELSHIRNYDIRLMTLVIVLIGTVTVMADIFLRSSLYGGRRRSDRDGGGAMAIAGLILIVLSPIVAQAIRLAVSRRREFLADSSAALITRHPDGLARALRKIRQDARPMAGASKATAHLFFANPLSGQSLARIFSTHPPIEDRIAALERMDGRTS